jgi:hypothetical protein
MAIKTDVLLPQLKAIKTTDLSPLIRMAGAMLPRVLDGFIKSLDAKQKAAFDKVLPVGGEKKIYLHLVDTPTPPIVVCLAQPVKMSTLAEKEVKGQGIKGVRLTVDDLQVLAGGLSLGTLLRLGWRLKGQAFTLLGILWMFGPMLLLGPSELRDLQDKAATRFKPLFDLLPRPKK